MSSKNNVLEEEPTVRRIINEESTYEEYIEDEDEEYEEDNNSVEEVPACLYFDLVSYTKDLGIPIAEYLTSNTIDEFVESFLPE
jgi:hypothetical protein